ncbi:hypothetical protein Pmani_039228 [Petrolisthes manimaculis]|uniref:Uncharacterized protein n=1 Tax=Petrolisthes manimaculis TaxID=1843537 RepID=A0AAE1TJG7_9EUCA|nr:hypothetical protein Pmani_039228 [Petrolisthes manimaculis]
MRKARREWQGRKDWQHEKVKKKWIKKNMCLA